MDLKALAAARLVKLLHDATGLEPRRWDERRGLQREIKNRLGIDEGMVSKVRRGETPSVNLKAINSIWMKTGIRPSYFVEPMSPPPIYTDFLTKADPFADLRKQEPIEHPRKVPPTSPLDANSLRQLAKEIVEIAESRSSPDAAIAVEARRGSFRSAARGDGLHRAKSSRADDDRKRRETPPPEGGRSAAAKRKR